jgi:hypothetical protein
MPFYRRGGRAVECTGLENRRGVKPTQGSNPCPSANLSSLMKTFTRRFLNIRYILPPKNQSISRPLECSIQRIARATLSLRAVLADSFKRPHPSAPTGLARRPNETAPLQAAHVTEPGATTPGSGNRGWPTRDPRPR